MKRILKLAFFICILNTITAQQINQEIKIADDPAFLVGQITIDGLTSNSYNDWYANNHDSYKVDTETIATIKTTLQSYHILIFMGTWCGDSKREVPRFIKILETADFPMEHLKIVALDRREDHYKMSPNGEEWGLAIKRVPTFIFYKNGSEVNRIIESPIVTLEADIKAIVNNLQYTPNYPQSLHFD